MTGSQEVRSTANVGVTYRYCRCPSALTPREYSWESASWWDESISFRIFQPSSLWKSVYDFFVVEFISCVFFFFMGLKHRDTPLYKKQTAPTSTPNSWSAPPTSIGAISTMGRREVFCVLYSKTVLPHRPVCFCGWREEKKSLSNQAFKWFGSKSTLYFMWGILSM